MATWYLYVVRCSTDGSFYTGVTTDVARRVEEHNQSPRGARYTRARRPVALVYSREVSGGRGVALKAERAFKKLSRTEKLQVMREPIPENVTLIPLTFGRVRAVIVDPVDGGYIDRFW